MPANTRIHCKTDIAIRSVKYEQNMTHSSVSHVSILTHQDDCLTGQALIFNTFFRNIIKEGEVHDEAQGGSNSHVAHIIYTRL